MQNKHLKFWLFAFVWTFIAVSATAYYSGRGTNFYLGQAVFDGRQAMGSVLGSGLNAASADASAAEPDAPKFPDITAKPATEAKAPEAGSNQQQATPKPATKAPCSVGETPVLRGEKVIGCSVAHFALQNALSSTPPAGGASSSSAQQISSGPASAPAPKIKVVK